MLDTTAILIAVALLIGNAFFVGAEFSLISARRTQIEPRAAAGSWSARITLRAMEHVSLMLAGAQLGITICSLGLGAIGEPAVAHVLEIPLAAIGITGAGLHTVAFAVALGIVVFLHMVLGEMVPKNIAISGPERSALILGPVLYGIVVVLRPVIWLLNWVANALMRVLKVEPKDEVASAFTADEVAAFIAESREEGLLEDHAHRLLSGSVTIGTETVAAVMVPLEQLVTVRRDSTPQEVESAFVHHGYSRFPVEGTDGRIEGYVHLKDFLSIPEAAATRPLDDHLVRPLASMGKDATLEAALATMQAGGTHFSLVVDGGETIGAAMLEDVVERLIGEVRDAATVSRRPGIRR